MGKYLITCVYHVSFLVTLEEEINSCFRISNVNMAEVQTYLDFSSTVTTNRPLKLGI
jgi:hypothetical protein